MANIETITVGNITYDIIGGGYAVSEEYSTTEKVVGTYINGKPIYQKTFTNLKYGNTAGSWSNIVAYSNVSAIVNAWGCRSTDGAVFNPFGFRYNNGYFQYITTSGASMQNVDIFIVEYTKTTD